MSAKSTKRAIKSVKRVVEALAIAHVQEQSTKEREEREAAKQAVANAAAKAAADASAEAERAKAASPEAHRQRVRDRYRELASRNPVQAALYAERNARALFDEGGA